MTSPFSPNVTVQTTYTYGRGRALPGERPRANIYSDRPIERCVFPQDDQAQTDTITFATTNNGDAVAINIDGASIPFVASTTLTLTALAARDALRTAGLSGIFVGVIDPVNTIAAVAVLTLVFLEPGPRVVSFTGTAGTTATITAPATVPGTLSVKAKAGTVAVYNTTQGDPTLLKCAEPSATDIRPVGVICRGPYNAGTTPPGAFGLFAGESWPAKVMVSCWQKADVEVRIASDVTAGGQCYFVATGPGTPNNGYFVGSDLSTAGTSQVTRGDVVFNGTDAVGLDVDALPTLQVASVTSDDLTATALRNAWNASAQHFAAATATIDLSGAESYIILSFKDTAVHTVVAYSPATADIVGITNTTAAVPAVAATAVLYPGATFVETRTADQLQATVDLG